MTRTWSWALVLAAVGLGCAGPRHTAKPPPPPPPPTETPASSPSPRAEREVAPSVCAQVMDRYIDLEIATNPLLSSLPPDVLEKARQAARADRDAPCTATPAQVECAMAATSTSAWRLCLRGRA